MKGKHEPNKLIDAASPYLQQHAYNPVHWFEWGGEALDKARAEDKPILLSIGYSSCHWCHVMEEEDFENEEIADAMNRHFVSVKVDREERPDIDQLYMEAAQLMGLGGGWPLNVFLTPDRKPFYAGTYFPPEQWLQLLTSIARGWREQREAINDSAQSFADSLKVSELKRFGVEADAREYSEADLDAIYSRLAELFDREQGGTAGAPKFPLPVLWKFLLRCHVLAGNPDALSQTTLTLDKMAMGGIYDQIGGGFARYSTDPRWFAPHFEKMLYDNAQLVSLYSEAYRVTGSALYRETVEETLAFVHREMTAPDGGFYSALDADSEGVEGKYYVWSYKELEDMLGEDLALFCDYYGVTESSNWEHGNILHRRESIEAFAERHGLGIDALRERVRQWQGLLLEAREKRVRPALDDKVLTSWNGMMLTACTDAYRAFQREEFLELGTHNAEFIVAKLMRGDGGLFHTCKDGQASIAGYLEDYAHVIHAFRGLYEITFDEKWLGHAEQLTRYALDNFFDADEQLFFFTDAAGERLIARKKEITDSVIPGSNSMMANNLLFLGTALGNGEWTRMARDMLSRVSALLQREPRALANWGCLLTALVRPLPEVAIVGDRCRAYRERIEAEFLPNAVFAGTESGSDLPLLRDRPPERDRTQVFVCREHACGMPVDSPEEALEQIRSLQG